MTAAEVLLFGVNEKFKTYVLARRASFLLCGDDDGTLCGRGRDSCVVLTTDPHTRLGLDELVRIGKLGNADYRWRCSDRHHVLDWYSASSRVVHDGEIVDRKAARQLVFWLTHRLLPAALQWFADYPVDPNGSMVAALAELPEPPVEQLEYKERYLDLASRGAFKID